MTQERVLPLLVSGEERGHGATNADRLERMFALDAKTFRPDPLPDRVVKAIREHQSADGWCSLTLEQIAQAAGTTKTATGRVSMIVATLAKRGIVEVEPRQGKDAIRRRVLEVPA